MPEQDRAQGCLVAVVRPVARVVAVLVVVPVRFVWELLLVVLRPVGVALGWCGWLLGRVLYGSLCWPLLMLYRYLLTPLGRALAWLGRVLVVIPLGWLYRAALTPLGHALAAACGWLWRSVLVPVGRGLLVVGAALGAACGWLFRWLVLVPLVTLFRYVLVPIGVGLRFLVRYLLVVPLGWLWRTVLHPVLRVVVWAWRLGGRVWRFLVVRPCRWVRREMWWPAKAEVRRVVREVRRALLG